MGRIVGGGGLSPTMGSIFGTIGLEFAKLWASVLAARGGGGGVGFWGGVC
jgi:hypothetical protein